MVKGNGKRSAVAVLVALIVMIAIGFGGYLFLNRNDIDENAHEKGNVSVAGEVAKLPDIQLLPFPAPRENLTAAQEQFWQFVNNYRREALVEKKTQTIREEAGITSYKYLPEKTYASITRSLVITHIPDFLMRYSWVEGLMDQYSIKELNVDLEVESSRKGLEDHFYYKLKDIVRANNDSAKKGEEDPQHRRAYVKAYLEAVLVFDFIYSRGDRECRENAFNLLYKILAPMRFDVNFSRFYGEMEQKGIEDIALPAILEFPDKFNDINPRT